MNDRELVWQGLLSQGERQRRAFISAWGDPPGIQSRALRGLKARPISSCCGTERWNGPSALQYLARTRPGALRQAGMMTDLWPLFSALRASGESEMQRLVGPVSRHGVLSKVEHKLGHIWLLALFLCFTSLTTFAGNPDAMLQFLDGSLLHGKLGWIEINKGISWNHAAATQPIEFSLTNIAGIKFENSRPLVVQSNNTCRFRFSNGDEVFGNLISLSEGTLEFETWFGNNLKAPQKSLQSIVFSPRGFKTFYEGPRGTDGWTMGKPPKAWIYRDGTFISNGTEILGRNLGITNSCNFSFDLGWNSSFSLSLTLFAEAIDRFDYNTSAYIFYFALGSISVQRIQPGAGTVLVGQVNMPGMLRKNSTRFEIRSNRQESTLALWADGALVQKWKDNAPAPPKGSGVVFFSQMDGQAIKISNIKATEWDGRFEQEPPPDNKEDLVFLMNRDHAAGGLDSIRDGKLRFASGDLKLNIPMERITQIYFGRPAKPVQTRSPHEVRLFFSAGETVAFDLEKWAEDKVFGQSANFGRVVFSPESIREMQLNLERSHRATTENNPTEDKFLEVDE